MTSARFFAGRYAAYRLRMTAALLLTACEIQKVAIPQTESRVAMHSVLSASAPSQVVLLERTRNGSVSMFSAPFDLEEPVGSDDGIAESGATVTLVTPSGTTLLAREDNTISLTGQGRGVYRFALAGDALERAGTYRLDVRTSKGENLSADTSVPGGVAASVASPLDFDRTRDTVVVAWPASPGARSYFVRIETPFGPRWFFTDSTRIRLTGELRNTKAAGIPRVFFPGFQQAVTVSAVDSNYFDWFRTHNDEVAGTGLISRVRGGIGVFGALVRLQFQDFHVVVPQPEPEAGTFLQTGTATEVLSTPYVRLELYVESRSARGDQADAISGRYEKRLTIGEGGAAINGLLGTVRGGRIEAALLRGWTATDTADVLTGEIRGDTIVGSYLRAGGPVRFVRQP